MSENSSSSSSGGVGVLGLLGVAFVVLKLMGIITWSWWWVTLPFWGGLALVIGIILIGAVGVGIVGGTAAVLAEQKSRKRIRERSSRAEKTVDHKPSRKSRRQLRQIEELTKAYDDLPVIKDIKK